MKTLHNEMSAYISNEKLTEIIKASNKEYFNVNDLWFIGLQVTGHAGDYKARAIFQANREQFELEYSFSDATLIDDFNCDDDEDLMWYDTIEEVWESLIIRCIKAN
jgi:hypothetical protein